MIKVGEFVETKKSGEQVTVYNNEQYQDLQSGKLTFSDVRLQTLDARGIIGPITKIEPLVGANNFAVALQIPVPCDPHHGDPEADNYVWIMGAIGGNGYVNMLEEIVSRQRAAEYVDKLNFGRGDNTPPLEKLRNEW